MDKRRLSSHGVKSLKVALAALEPRGVSARACLRGTGVAESDLDNPDLRVGVRQELVFYRNVLEQTGDPLIGLHIGAQYRLPNYGIWGYAVMSASDLRAALTVAFRFLYLTYTCHEVTLETGIESARLALVPLGDYGACAQAITDRDVSALFHLASEMLGRRLPLDRIAFIHRGARQRRAYRDYFGCDVEFGHRRTEMHLPAAVLDCALPTSDPYTARLTAQHCELVGNEVERRTSVAREIQRHILARPGRFPGIAAIARTMGRSERGLRRALSEEGQSYSVLIGELRYRMAREYLEMSTLTMQQIALSLGYSEASNFTHAFKRWSGMSPQAYREAHGQSARRGNVL